MTQSSPTVVEWNGVQWMTVPSWIDVRAPTVIGAPSPRSTAPGHTDASGPMRTSPISTASGWTYAVGSTCGWRSPSAYRATRSPA
jgi:hypothetical protein